MYDPRSAESRTDLANRLRARLTECGFGEEHIPGTREKVFSRQVDGSPRVRVMVYTTIEGSQVRSVGRDAIRVCAVYTNREGRDRGIIAAEKRVNRTGAIGDIVERMVVRMREVYGGARKPQCCPRCRAPLFASKNKNNVCSEFCWKA